MSRLDATGVMDEALAAYNRYDWTALRTVLAADLRVADHRPAPALYDGIVGADTFIEALKPLLELASGVAVRTVAVHEVNDRAGVHQLSTIGITPEGSDLELAFHLGYLVEGGKIVRFDFFADDRLAEARSLLAAL
jgi:ketosteroid isomerase-like protein